MDDDGLGQPSTPPTGHDTTDAHGNPGDEGRERSTEQHSGGYRVGGLLGYGRTPQPHAVTKEYSCTFNMGFKHRGKAVIFNNKNFHSSTRMSIRNGTDVDASNLETLFENMGFLVSRHNDCSADKMVSTMKQEAKDDDFHRNADCFACIILSHGDDDDIIYGTDKELSLQKLVEPFKGLPSLAGKPKLFFIQACRGDSLDAGMEVCDAPYDDAETRRIPTEADFFMAYSCVPGYYSWRNSEKGSWFVQALVKVFSLNNNWQRMDLLTLMTRVTKEVAYEFESNCPQKPPFHRKKQVPSITSMLTKDVYFTPKP